MTSGRRWRVGDRVVWPHKRPGRGNHRMHYTPGTVTAVDLPRVPPGAEVTFDRPEPITGLLTCYATHRELEPEEPPMSRTLGDVAALITARTGRPDHVVRRYVHGHAQRIGATASASDATVITDEQVQALLIDATDSRFADYGKDTSR